MDYSDLNQILNSLDSSSSYTTSTSSLYGTAASTGIWLIIALILAIIGGILVHFLFVKSKTEPKGKFLKWLKDFLAFKVMWIEPILKVVYYIATIFVILYSFTYFGMFNVMGGLAFLMFLLTLVLGPIIVRLFYEATMMFIMIWRNTKDIADNTKK
ncbi:DUF4282 domain-containing protein [Candidatus Saccharibacteria bacterium]|nr:DUF4282 domain-containing protein [Candidatus Saccharibacteria bacterium]